MKKLLLLTLLALNVGSSLQAATASENYVGLKEWGKGMKEYWLNHTKGYYDEKFDLMISQSNDWFDHGIEMLKKFQIVTDENQKQALFKKELQNAVDIISKHMSEWKELCDKYYTQGSKQQDVYAQQLKDFAKKAGVKVNESLIPLQVQGKLQKIASGE